MSASQQAEDQWIQAQLLDLNGTVAWPASMGGHNVQKKRAKALAESLSAEVKSEGVNVNRMLPSAINTLVNRQSMPSAQCEPCFSTDDLVGVIVFPDRKNARAIYAASIPVQALV